MTTTTPTPTADATAPLRLIALALLPFGAGYFLSYLFRAVNAVVAPELVSELGLSAAALGLMTSAYLASFALFQLPLGILLDRYGPRRVQAILVAIGGAGALLFGIGNDAATLVAARAIIGLGFAGGLMAGFKAVVIWVAPERRALANALVMSAGAIGLIVSTTPTQWAVGEIGWRAVFLALAGITFVVAALIWTVVPERKGIAPEPAPLGKQISQLGRIMTDRMFLAIAPLLSLTAGTQIAIQTLWAGPWMRDVAGLDPDGVAGMLAFAAWAFLFGVLASGAIADRLQAMGVSLLTTMGAFIVVFIAAQVAIILEWTDYNLPVWFVFGMSGQVAVLAYPWLSQHFGTELAGRSNAAVNLALFATAFVLQYAIGLVIDAFPQTEAGGYATEGYQTAFGICLALQVAALAWFALNLPRIRAAERSFNA
ncbi:MAG: MFS transporter [Pseudomonadota bacterium]